MKQLRGLSVAGCVGIVVAFGGSASGSSPTLSEVKFECGVQGNNDGCEKTIACPAGTTIKSATAACNLELGAVRDGQLATVEEGFIEVLRASDHVDEGRCWLGWSQTEDGVLSLADNLGLSAVAVGCQEHDKNGGDCEVRGSIYCQ